jgi:hypothetical protein
MSGTGWQVSRGRTFCFDPQGNAVLTMYRELGYHQQALYCYRKVYSLDPTNVDALWDRASLAKETGDLRTVCSFLLVFSMNIHNFTSLRPAPPTSGSSSASRTTSPSSPSSAPSSSSFPTSPPAPPSSNPHSPTTNPPTLLDSDSTPPRNHPPRSQGADSG